MDDAVTPPLPPGFTLDATPPLPPGFTLDATPPLPAGFTLDQPSNKAVEAPTPVNVAPSPPMGLREVDGKLVAAPVEGPVNQPQEARGIVQRIVEGFKQGGGTDYQPKGESRLAQAADLAAHDVLAFPGRVVGAGSGVVAGILEKLGMAPTSADKLQRDVGVAAQVAVPEMARGVMPKQTAVRPKEIADPARPVENPQVAQASAAPPASGSPPPTPQVAANSAGPPAPPPGGTPPVGPGHNNPPPGPLPLAPAQQAVLARIGKQPDASRPITELAHDAYTQLVDDLHPIKRVVEEGTPALEDPYMAFRLTRGSAGKAEHMLRHGTFDFATLNNTGRPLVEALDQVRNDRDGFTAYLLSKRALELDQRGIDTGIPLAEARQVANAAKPEYLTAAKALDDFQTDTLKYFKDSGIISQDAFDAMRNASASYVPLYRAFEAEPMARRFNVSNTIKRLTGSDEKILDPIESVIRNTYVLTEMAERNRAATTLVDYARNNPTSLPLQKVVSATAKPVTLTPAEIDRIMADYGVPQSVYGQAGTFDIFRPDRKAGLGEGEFAVYENGKRTVYKTTPEIADAVKRMDQQELGLFTRMLAAPSRLLRAGVTLDPTYMARNLIRDQLSAAVQSRTGYKPGASAARQVPNALARAWDETLASPEYKEWLKSGAAQSTLVSQDRNYTTNFIREYGAKPNVWEAIKRNGGKPIEVLRDLSEAVDNITRLAEFSRARKQGASIPEAGFRAREVTQDFQRVGAKTRAWNAVVAFANGQVQGLDRELRNFKDRPFAASGKVATYITLPSILFWMANKDDPRYQNADNDTKDKFWLYLPEDPKAEPIKIPKGFTTGIAGGSLIERTLDRYFKERPEAYKDFAKNLLGSMEPNKVPTAIAPVLDQMANQYGFGQLAGDKIPLVGQRLQRLPKEEQVGQNTSDTARAVGKATGGSPVVIDNYIRAWGGTLGQYVKAGSDAAVRSLGLLDKRPEGPEGGLSSIPGLRSFVMKYPSANAQPIKDFYDKYDETEKAYNSARAERRRGGTGSADVMRLAGYKRQLDAAHREVRETYEAKDLSPSAKKVKIDAAYMRMLDIAQRGLKFAREREQGYTGPR